MTKTNKISALPLLVFILLATGCSTQKNTASSRAFHSMKTKYNIYFNGNTSFDEGLKATQEANQDNYSALLPLYPQSNHEAAKAATSQMDRTIEKCRKCIKLHSIKKKPKINLKKRNDPEYKAWLEHEEFNESIDDAWILLGKAEFHKGDFEGCIGTFRYIINHFGYDKDIVAQCQLWIVRAYTELGWLYEADELLKKVNVDDLKRKNAPLYSATSANLLIKQGNYKDAIPFIKIAVQDEKRDGNRPRFYFALGQLYENVGSNTQACDYYKKVIKMNPEWEMDFNARLRSARLSTNTASAVKQLGKMAKRYKYKDKLDQIYEAIGDVYLSQGDTANAIKNYAEGIEKSTQKRLEKASVLIKLGDLYYDKKNYKDATPCYTEASSIIDNEHSDFKRVKRLSETLQQLTGEYDVVVLQDSLQHLATLSEEEQLEIAKKIVENLEKEEKEAAEKAQQEERELQNNEGLRSVDTQNMLGGGGGTADWYFYNQQLIRSGRQQFQQKWGNRKLEDNWRLMAKNFSTSFVEDNQTSENNISENDSTLEVRSNLVTDSHDPQYYLQQIPKTAEEIAKSDSLIAKALYNMFFIYRDQIEDQEMASLTFDDYQKRFPNDKKLIDLYYSEYINAIKTEDIAAQSKYRKLIVEKFPESGEAQIVSQPDYFNRILRLEAEQDSVYEQTYYEFTHNNFEVVKKNKQYAQTNYPLSKLMPKFLFLNSIAVAKTEGQDAFISELREMIDKYPESDVSAMAKDMLAMLNVGAESQADGEISNLADKRTTIETEIDSSLVDKSFSTDMSQNTLIYYICRNDEQTVNALLYEIALFNFSQFLIKDFDLKKESPLHFKQKIDTFNQTEQEESAAVEVVKFDNYDEALWYNGLIMQNESIRSIFTLYNVSILIITEENDELLRAKFTLEEYRKFEKEKLTK